MVFMSLCTNFKKKETVKNTSVNLYFFYFFGFQDTMNSEHRRVAKGQDFLIAQHLCRARALASRQFHTSQ